MPILSGQIKLFKSSNGVGLGGPISPTEIQSGALNNIFDDVSSSEALDGDVEYRCVYVKNENGSIPLKNGIAYIFAQTSSPDTNIEIGLGVAGPNNDEPPIPDESTAPVGVLFESDIGPENGIIFVYQPPHPNAGDPCDIDANGGYYPIWIKRVVNAAAGATSSDVSTLAIRGETTA